MDGESSRTLAPAGDAEEVGKVGGGDGGGGK